MRNMTTRSIDKSKQRPVRVVRPDAKGRVALGDLTHGVSSFQVLQDSELRIILVPFAEIPAQEKWVFENTATLAKIKRGLKDAAEGKTKNLGSFAKYKDDEID
jgi:hypothetical protein